MPLVDKEIAPAKLDSDKYHVIEWLEGHSVESMSSLKVNVIIRGDERLQS